MSMYYARTPNDAGEWETAEHHLRRAGELCASFLQAIGYPNRGEMMGRVHDFGKLSPIFQQVLLGKKIHVNHALPGAVLAQKCCPGSEAVIAGHHCGLQSRGHYRSDMEQARKGTGDGRDQENYEISIYGPAAYREAMTLWKSMFPDLKRPEAMPSFSGAEDQSVSRMLFQRMLFSALVDADWSASAEHFDSNYLKANSGNPLDPETALELLLELRREKQRVSGAADSLNALRDGLFDRCLAMGKEAPGLFTLTAPTGLGKTLSLMAFALKHAVVHQKRRVILILPYLSILEQNCRDYRKILPDLLEVHSNTTHSEDTRELVQRWDTGCIVTTNVSFFEPLFSAQGASCRHLHQIANSVIVLDEAQTLPAELLDATLRTVKELCDRYGCTVVFSTATQPSFQHRPGLDWKPREIVPEPEKLFQATRRVQWNWEVKEPKQLADVAAELAAHPQCCAIVNLKAHARKLWTELSAHCPEGEVFYLTTDLCPAHRSNMLDAVRERLATGQPCRLVATQCIEAGVDLDFPVVWRALAPLDSLIQAAGRCNRNGDAPNGRVTVFVPEEERLYPTEEYGRGALCVKTLRARHDLDCANLKHIEEYYQLLYGAGNGDKRKLVDAITEEDYPAVEHEYKMIPNSGVQIIVPYPERMDLFEEIRDTLDREGLTPTLLRKAKELTVASFDRKNAERYCQRLCFRKTPTDIYLLGDPQFYDEHLGLRFEKPFDGIL